MPACNSCRTLLRSDLGMMSCKYCVPSSFSNRHHSTPSMNLSCSHRCTRRHCSGKHLCMVSESGRISSSTASRMRAMEGSWSWASCSCSGEWPWRWTEPMVISGVGVMTPLSTLPAGHPEQHICVHMLASRSMHYSKIVAAPTIWPADPQALWSFAARSVNHDQCEGWNTSQGGRDGSGRWKLWQPATHSKSHNNAFLSLLVPGWHRQWKRSFPSSPTWESTAPIPVSLALVRKS